MLSAQCLIPCSGTFYLIHGNEDTYSYWLGVSCERYTDTDLGFGSERYIDTDWGLAVNGALILIGG